MKIIGAFIIIFSSVMIALRYTERIEQTLKGVSALRALLEHSKNMIECYSLPASEILKRTKRSIFVDCGYGKDDLPSDFLELASESDILDFEAREIILSFAKDFGKSYRRDELSRCSLYLERMRAREQKLAKESTKKKKVIFTVAICSALAVIILII